MPAILAAGARKKTRLAVAKTSRARWLGVSWPTPLKTCDAGCVSRNAHVEYFGIMSQGKAVAESQHYFSTGAHFDLTKVLELGIRIGFGLNAQTPPFFSNAGVGFRF